MIVVSTGRQHDYSISWVASHRQDSTCLGTEDQVLPVSGFDSHSVYHVSAQRVKCCSSEHYYIVTAPLQSVV